MQTEAHSSARIRRTVILSFTLVRGAVVGEGAYSYIRQTDRTSALLFTVAQLIPSVVVVVPISARMRPSDLFLLSFGLPVTHAAETILGVYIFSRHGDRTSKSLPPADLTDLGYQEIFTSGTYFRDRYVSSTASARIAGIDSDLVKQSQITVSAPLDTVLMNSAQGFLQGLYPPVGTTLGSNKLRNGTVVQAPLNGYQLIPVQQVTSGTASEDSAWLQGSSNCAKATVSSNEYFQSQDYHDLLHSTADFYKSLAPVINGTFSGDQISYKNAYTGECPVHKASTLADYASLRSLKRSFHSQCHHQLFGSPHKSGTIPNSHAGRPP